MAPSVFRREPGFLPQWQWVILPSWGSAVPGRIPSFLRGRLYSGGFAFPNRGHGSTESLQVLQEPSFSCNHPPKQEDDPLVVQSERIGMPEYVAKSSEFIQKLVALR